MSRADVLTLAQFYANDLADNSALDRFLDDVIYEQGREPIMMAVSLDSIVSGQGPYDYPAGAIELFDVFFDGKILSCERQETLEVLSRTWQSSTGTPIAWVKENEEKAQYRLYPKSTAATGSMSFPNGEPFGVDLPDNALVIIHSEYRQDVLPWMEDWIALEIAAREFSRESDHQDPAIAKALADTGQLLRQMVM